MQRVVRQQEDFRDIPEKCRYLKAAPVPGMEQGRSFFWSGRYAGFCKVMECKPPGICRFTAERKVGNNMKTYKIKEQECGYLLKKGKFVKILTVGTYTFFDIAGAEVQIVPMKGEVKTCDIPEEILMRDETFASRVVKVELPDTSIAIRFVNGAFREVITKPEALYWNVFEKNEFQVIDITKPCMEESLPRMYMDLMPSKYYKKIVIKDGEVGLLYFDNWFEKRLETGTYFFWNYGKEVTCKIFNMKIQQLEISGQEILTADKVSVRLNVVCNYRITDPERLVKLVDGAAAQLYSYAQLVLREYIGRYRLDELLAQREEISRYVGEKMKEKEQQLCVEFIGAGIKDIILPGEIRDIMNTVLIAEKRAQANVIMRREEVASTRSLLNTAKMMDENKTLFKLKEMEYLEKICDKVGSITINGGGSVLEQLAELAGTQKS